MVKREDGKQTRRRVLTAAVELFSRKGYERVKVAEICRRARANQASVSYYFGDKAGLYTECWQYAVARFGEVLLVDPEETPPEIQLRNYIRRLMRNFYDDGEKGDFSRLYMMELVHPTGLIQRAWLDMIQPNRQRFHSIIARIMGRTPTYETLVFCELGIASQCRSLLTITPGDMDYFLDRPMNQTLINRMADHICAFSLAGIRAVADR